MSDTYNFRLLFRFSLMSLFNFVLDEIMFDPVTFCGSLCTYSIDFFCNKTVYILHSAKALPVRHYYQDQTVLTFPPAWCVFFSRETVLSTRRHSSTPSARPAQSGTRRQPFLPNTFLKRRGTSRVKQQQKTKQKKCSLSTGAKSIFFVFDVRYHKYKRVSAMISGYNSCFLLLV